MGKHGQANFRGVDAQSWSAIALFLQLVDDPNFLRIDLESDASEDFDLVFEDQRIIRAESKSWRTDVSFPAVREIIQAFLDKDITIGEKDLFLIVCQSVSPETKSRISQCERHSDNLRDYFENWNFSPAQFELLSKVRFWTVSRDGAQFLATQLFSNCLDFWVPEQELEDILKRIVVDKIYRGSGLGLTFSQKEFWELIDHEKKRYQESSRTFDPTTNPQILQINELINAINNSHAPVWSDDHLSALSSQPVLMNYVIQKIGSAPSLELRAWEPLWKANLQRGLRSGIFDIFKKQLISTSNVSFVLDFLETNLPTYVGTFNWQFIENDVTSLLEYLLQHDDTHFDRAFKIIKILFDAQTANIFFTKTRDDSRYRREVVAKFLLASFDGATKVQRQELYNFVIEKFNLVRDDGEFWEYSPPPVFELVCKFLTYDFSHFETNYLQLKDRLGRQFSDSYVKFGEGLEFEGWEHFASGGAWWGDEFKHVDRQIVRLCLAPALVKFYENHRNRALTFAVSKCVVPEEKVSDTNPDFLIRATIPLLMRAYREDSDDVFDVILDLATRKKGVHSKRDLIFGALRHGFDEQKQWRLIEQASKSFKGPGSPFIEEIVAGLVTRNHHGALSLLKSWYMDEDYLKGLNWPGNKAVSNIRGVLQTNPNEASELFLAVVNSDYFKNHFGEFEVYEWAKLLNEFLVTDFGLHRKLLTYIWKEDPLSLNEQLLFTNAFLNSRNEKDASPDYPGKLYDEIVSPFLEKSGLSSEGVRARIPTAGARTNFIRLAEVLAKTRTVEDGIGKAIRIIEVFKDDPDPFLPTEEANPDHLKYNKHLQIESGKETNTIESVRGFCAWSLMYCVHSDGKEHLPMVIDLVRHFLIDRNYYIQNLALTSLSHLVRCRFSRASHESQELLYGETLEDALKVAAELEGLAVTTIERIMTYPEPVRKCLAPHVFHVVDAMKLTTFARAKRLIESFEELPPDSLKEAAPLYLFFAEFREIAEEDTKEKRPELAVYLDLGRFDTGYFKDLFRAKCQSSSSELTSSISWHLFDMCRSPGESPGRSLVLQREAIEKVLPYFNLLSERYDQSTISNIYLFIRECIEMRFSDVLELWKRCVLLEADALNAKVDSKSDSDVRWASFAFNAEILGVISEQGGAATFIDCFKLLLEYPKQTYLGNFQKPIDILDGLREPQEEIIEIFDKLIERGMPNVFDIKQEWLARNNDES